MIGMIGVYGTSRLIRGIHVKSLYGKSNNGHMDDLTAYSNI